ncbi:MAG: MATE family efflux transporter [Treponema sp.]|nr:MATE family efflux transporter [Treponema sp.]
MPLLTGCSNDKDTAVSEPLFSSRTLWQLIWPLLVEQLLQITLGMADIIMVSSLGEASVSGVSLVDQLNILIVQIFAALATGGAVVCSQYIGRKSLSMAQKTAMQLLYATTAIAVFLAVTGTVFHKGILSVVFGNVEQDVMTASRRYFLITLLALPSIAIYNAAAAIFRSRGNSGISMWIAALVNVINIGGNAILIYGLHWGVEGVAVPTLVSRTVAAAVLFVCLYRDSDVCIKGIFHVHIDFHLIGRILRIGIPNGLEGSTFQIGKILVLSLIASYGTSAIAANAAANTLASFEVLPGNAIGIAMLTVVGQCMGAKEYGQAVNYTKKMMTAAYLGFLVLNVPLLLFSYRILSFYGMSEETTRLGWYMTLIHGICGIFIWPLSFSLPNALRAAGDSSFTMIVSMVSMWTVRVGLSFVLKATGIFGLVAFFGLPVSFGSVGVWISMIVDWIVRSSFFVVRFVRGKWKQKQVI